MNRGDDDRASTLVSWLERPLAASSCVLGWVSACLVFFGLTALEGGPSQVDQFVSVLSTWAISHGNFACAYPPVASRHTPLTAPLYPLISGGIAWLFRIGHKVPFPNQSALGPHCAAAFGAILKWSIESQADKASLAIGYLSWFVLLGGLIALLRSAGRGRCGWEPTILVLVALTTPAFTALGVFFHPQDIVALGLSLWGVARARQGMWAWAGVLLGLALCSQQFAILAVVPLVVVAPRSKRLTIVASVIATAAVIDVPLLLMTSGRAFTAAVIGTGGSPSYGGTILDELGFHKPTLVLLSRTIPIALSVALAAWARLRLGPRALEPVALISLIATAFSFRLAFELNLFDYYFMATAVTLVVLDASLGRIRGILVAWLALVTWAFNPLLFTASVTGHPVRVALYDALPIVFIGVALLLIALDAYHHRIRWYLVTFLLLVLVARAHEGWRNIPSGRPTSIWYWQLVLVPVAMVWAVRPLVSLVRNRYSFEEAQAAGE